MEDISEPYDCFEVTELPEHGEVNFGVLDCYLEEGLITENPSEPCNDFDDYEEERVYSVGFPVISLIENGHAQEKEKADSTLAASENALLTSDIYQPLDSFKTDDGGNLYLQYLDSAALTGILERGKGAEPAGADMGKRISERKADIGEIADSLIRQELFICINGEQLFMKKGVAYIQISVSQKSEIMHLKALLKQHGLRLNASDCKAILNELKTEEDIWAEDLESAGDGQYDISFLSGRGMHGVSGDFADYLVSGQLKNAVQPFSEGIRLFVSECCIIDAASLTESTILFCAYQNFMHECPRYIVAKQNQFVPFIKKAYGLQGGSTGKLRIIRGVCLRNEASY